MNVVATAIVPILLLLAAGVLLKRRVLTDEAFWSGLTWLSYWVFTPALFVTSIGSADLATIAPAPLVVSLAIPILATAGLALGLGRLVRADGPQLTSLVQGSIRLNTYIGLIFASALNGQAGVATFALASAIVVPLVNVICVTSLSLLGDRDAEVPRVSLWRDLAGNPLILACIAGLLINLFAVPLPSFAQPTLGLLAAPALVCGTLIAGAALRFTFRRRDVLDIGIATILKLAILPLSSMAIAISLGVSSDVLTAIVLICAVPTAPSAYVLASKMGGDARLIASITGVQTVIAVGSMPLMLALVDVLSS